MSQEQYEENAMEKLIERLMAHRYWGLLRLEKSGNFFIRDVTQGSEFRKNQGLSFVMMGFYPLSYSILLAFRQIEMLAPSKDVRNKAHFFVEVEEGKLAASDWYRNVTHSELYRRMFSSLASAELAVDEQMLNQYLSALNLKQGGLARAVVTAAFIEKTGLAVLNLLHDFVAQWQVFTGQPTSKIDLTYLNEHMLHEGDGSDDQHVRIIDNLIGECGSLDLQNEARYFGRITEEWFTHIDQLVLRTGMF